MPAQKACCANPKLQQSRSEVSVNAVHIQVLCENCGTGSSYWEKYDSPPVSEGSSTIEATVDEPTIALAGDDD